MNYGGRIVADMGRLVALFRPLCPEHGTFDDLARMIADPKTWSKGHDLFDRIRAKTLSTERQENEKLEVQYLFEEVCAKTLYNLVYPSDPFDADSPYWIVPNAFALARALELVDSLVLKIVIA
jgi:hypothetical protein